MPHAAGPGLSPRRFGAFWMGGALSPMEQACLQSFAAKGFEVTLFSYGDIANTPPGVRRANAAEIVEPKWIDRFIYGGKPHIAHFSDYFRLKMFEAAGLTWIDADLALVNAKAMPRGGAGLVAREKQGGFNNAILYIADPGLQRQLISDVEQLEGQDLSWGQTGPLLLDRHGARLARSETLHGPDLFYPIDHDGIWKALLPEHRAWCEAQCRSAATLHLFNNVLVRMGYWKAMAPPAGSYLHACFQAADALHFFEATYPEAVMRHLTHNFVASQTGEDLGLKAVITQMLPSAARSYAHHAKAIAARVKLAGS
jgi:hypothetical protein